MIIKPKYSTAVGYELCISDSIFSKLDVYIGIYNIKRLNFDLSRFSNIYMDDREVECVSKPLIIKDIPKFYKDVERLAVLINGTIYSKEVNGGGCHINVDMCGSEINRDLFKLLMVLEGCNHPFLNWCLNDPWDDYNANSYLDEMSYSYNRIRMSTIKRLVYDYQRGYFLSGDKRYPISNRSSYIEFRLFDNPQNYQEFEAFTNIALRIRDKIIDRTKNFLPEYLYVEDKSILRINEKQAWDLFQRYIKGLKIPNPPMELWRKRLATRFKLFKSGKVKRK